MRKDGEDPGVPSARQGLRPAHAPGEAAAADLVRSFGASDGRERFSTYEWLLALGPAALPAIRAGLQSSNWQVRRWSAICLDRLADAEALIDLIPLLTDPHPQVRLWAVHSIACDHCKSGATCPEDVVPRLIERALDDPSVKVRRMAVIMLGSELGDARAIPPLQQIVETSTDAKLLAHAWAALAALSPSAARRPSVDA